MASKDVGVHETSKPVPRCDQAGLTYAWYVVFVLMLCYTLSLFDRQILSLLVAPIKQDLRISDTRIGLLQGLAFASFYTLLGLPMGRLADTANRRNLISVGVFFWSLMTAVCSLARNFWSLFLARMGVGVGEATLSPAAFSLIADYFRPEHLATALSVYSMGIFIGSGLALIVGGLVVHSVTQLPAVDVPVIGTIASWRLTFLIVGLPGVLVSVLLFSIREPLRRNLLRTEAGHVSRLGLGEVLHQVRLRWQSVVGLSLALAFQSACNFAFLAWAPTFFIRVHRWNPAQAGLALGLIVLVMGCLGLYSGGRICDRWQRRQVREAPLKVGVIATIGSGLLAPLALSLPYPAWTVALLVLAMPVGSSYASLQLIFPNQVRGQVSAYFLFILSLGGLTLGPLVPGLLNDYLLKNGNMMGFSLAWTIGMYALLSGLLFRVTYGPYKRHHAMMQPA
jgi:MFS family permease